MTAQWQAGDKLRKESPNLPACDETEPAKVESAAKNAKYAKQG